MKRTALAKSLIFQTGFFPRTWAARLRLLTLTYHRALLDRSLHMKFFNCRVAHSGRTVRNYPKNFVPIFSAKDPLKKFNWIPSKFRLSCTNCFNFFHILCPLWSLLSFASSPIRKQKVKVIKIDNTGILAKATKSFSTTMSLNNPNFRRLLPINLLPKSYPTCALCLI